MGEARQGECRGEERVVFLHERAHGVAETAIRVLLTCDLGGQPSAW